MIKFSKISRELRPKTKKYDVDLEFILTFYDAYIREPNLRKVAHCLGMTTETLNRILNRNIQLQQTRNTADHLRKKHTLKKYTLSHLSKEARKCWDRLEEADGPDQIEEILSDRTTTVRQQLFCHALLVTGFNLSAACSKVNISRRDIENWKMDLEFLQMLEEVQFHKKNFIENQLLGLVEEGHPGAVIFTSRTLNADRGYNEKLELSGHLQNAVNNGDFDIAELDLDLETMKKVLAAIERKKNRDSAEAGHGGIVQVKQIKDKKRK